MASLGFISFMKDHEGSGDLASLATPLVVHPGYVSQIHIMALCVWFANRTICEGWIDLSVADLRPLFDIQENNFFFCFAYAPLGRSNFLGFLMSTTMGLGILLVISTYCGSL